MKDASNVRRKILEGSKKNASGCWIWQRSIKQNGYGKVCYDGTSWYAHRASCIAFNGPVPEGWYVCHRCDVPSCVNPEHLYAGTAKQNQADSRARGRMNKPSGVRNHIAKLTDDKVRKIRQMLDRRNTELGQMFGVHPSIISLIRHGKIWKHV